MLPLARPILMLMLAAPLPVLTSAADTCRLGYPALEGISIGWQGPCLDGLAHGKGIIEARKNGKVSMLYEGMVERGMPNGKGYITFSSGTEYSGDFRDGLAHGNGVSVNHLGDRYKGEWRDFKRNGRGSMVYTLGGRYDGEWKDNEFHGHGVAVYVSGRRVKGEFINGRPAGSPASPSPPGSPEKYNLKEEIPAIATLIPRKIVGDFVIPFNASYEQLSQQQRRMVRSWYPMLDDSDEPPYPVRGLESVYRAIHKVNARDPAEGKLSMVVMVDSDGKATAANIFVTPNPAIAKLAGFLAMKENYKPARCSGKPCAMAFPYAMHFQINPY